MELSIWVVGQAVDWVRPQAVRVDKQRTGALRLSPELKERGGCRTLETKAKWDHVTS